MQSGQVDRQVVSFRRKPVGEALVGARLVCEGFRMLGREHGLWALSLVPVGFSAIALTIATLLVFQHAGAISGFIDGLWPVLTAGSWYHWLFVGPARLFFWVLGLILFIAFAALAGALAVLLASVATAPLLDALAYRVERLADERVLESIDSGAGALIRDVVRSIVGEARRILFFVAIWVFLFGVGFLVPGAHLLTAPLMLAVTVLFLPLEYSGYTLDRRQVPFAARRRWIVARTPRMIGFGTAAFVMVIVPGLNLLMIPGLVVAGTLLVLRDPPVEIGEDVERLGSLD